MDNELLSTEVSTEVTAGPAPVFDLSNLEALGLILVIGIGVVAGVLCSKSFFGRLKG